MSYATLSSVTEPLLQAFKDELDVLKIFSEINEGDKVYEGSDAWAMVVPGPDNISKAGMQQLLHGMVIWVLFLQEQSGSTPKELRKVAEQGYDKLMEDQTHGDTCWECLPILWDPGYMQYGETTFVGVQSAWLARAYQTYDLPVKKFTTFTDMETIIESVIAEFKKELGELVAIDDISEGEVPYLGSGTVAWVVPGRSTISSVARARLEHRFTIYQNLLTSSPSMTLREMRAIGEEAYDRLMEDVTHDRTCAECMPTLWHPGFLKYGEASYVGIQTAWDARVLQDYTPT